MRKGRRCTGYKKPPPEGSNGGLRKDAFACMSTGEGKSSGVIVPDSGWRMRQEKKVAGAAKYCGIIGRKCVACGKN